MNTITPIKYFIGARDSLSPLARIENIRAASHDFRKEMLKSNKVHFYQSVDLIKVPYPSYYGLRDAYRYQHSLAYLHILNRLFVVQFDTKNGIKTLLFSPSDHVHNIETPFFKRLSKRGPQRLAPFIAPILNTVEGALAGLGINPEQVDYISYDHLHTQDVRSWLGTDQKPAYFPNAKLLVQRQEWESTQNLSPIQAEWYCPSGIAGIPESKVILLDGDVMLGDGVALIHTPGHTEGNHSLVVHTDEGLWVTSENGVSADSYAPLASTIPGLRDYAKAMGIEVVMNGNTLENSIDQYISMIQEKTIAGPSSRNADFPNVFPSSELTPFWGNPLAKPGHYVGSARHGHPITTQTIAQLNTKS
ncbi:hypothetical protein [Aquirhabdus sp.]|uniref:hypothetical protein n=1 Tax=Aquirhabdus sp. TaxID=2824160 RepID=UPI00396C4622